MKKLLVAVLALSAAVSSTLAGETMEKKAEKVVKDVQKGCKTELSTFCKDVTPGEGRTLACLYAFEDKLTGECEYALFDAATKLQAAVGKLQHVASSCSDDIEKFCSDVALGQGRILNCLKKNKISNPCSKALKDTGL